MLHIQRYLAAGGTLDDLLARYAITAKRHREHPNLVHFSYNQIASPFGEPIVHECRGIILDESDGWRVVARAFGKFFNHGEGHAAAIDWSTARVQEKVDGSLITLYHYAGSWRVATTGTPDAGGNVHGLDASGTWQPRVSTPRRARPVTFADYFWQVVSLYEAAPTWRHDVPTDTCFFFELTGPLNRVVVPHTEARVTLLGARNRETDEEMPVLEAAALLRHRFPVVREFPLGSIEGILATFGALSPLAQEGYVVVDGSFNRIKVKHPGYVALHHAKDGLTTRAFVAIARSGEIPEVIAAFPELRPQLDDARNRLVALVAEVEADYARHRDIEEQRAFALAVKATRCPAALFSVRAKKASSVREFFATTNLDNVMRMLGYKASEPIAVAAE